MDGLRVSVAMCTYQGASFVADQLGSILEQAHPPDEVVVFDDASTDGTFEVVERLAESTRIPVRVCANDTTQGYRRNFEMAVLACSTDIIFLADQDDVWFPDKIGKMLPYLGADDAVLVHHDAVLADEHLGAREQTIFDRHPVLATENDDPLGLVHRMAIPGATMAFRSRLVEAIVPFSDLWGHDLWVALVGGALGRIVPVREPLMLYRRHRGGAGPSRYLDSGRVGRARLGIRTHRLADYELDLGKWRQLVGRIEELTSTLEVADPRRPRLERTLAEYRRRLDLARFRDGIRRRPRHRRVVPVLRRVATGDYRRYLRAAASPIKDVAL